MKINVYHHNPACAYTDDDCDEATGEPEPGTYPLAKKTDQWDSRVSTGLEHEGAAAVYECPKCGNEFVVEIDISDM